MLCPGSRGDLLSLPQPDPELPDRLLGICRLCKGWVVLESQGKTITPIGPSPPELN